MWSLDKGGFSSNSNIVPAELLPLIDGEIYTTFNKSVKSHYN